MSMISEQVKELRYKADIYNTVGSVWELNRAEAKILQGLLRQAADTIESLFAKLQAANMERSEEDCGAGWIPCKVENLPDEEVLCCDNYGEIILGYVFEDETSDTGFSAESGHEYMFGCVKWMEKPKS